MPNTIWIDVEDLFQYAALNPRPSGIQRIEYELCRSLATLPESRDRVRFVRHSGSQTSFYVISYSELDALYGALTSGERKAEPATPASRASRPLAKDPLRRFAYAMPPAVRNPVVTFYKAERDAGRAVLQAGAAIARLSWDRLKEAGQRRRARGMSAGGASMDGRETEGAAAIPFESACEPGDTLLVLGSPWFHPFYAALVERAQRQRGLHFALLVYDLIPLRRPEWCDHNLALRFREWTGDVFPLVDTFLTISRASADDITRHAEHSGFKLRSAPQPITIGTGFTSSRRQPQAAEPGVASARASQDRLPPPGSYALIVSTIEARKNHMLLFRVWRRMVEEMPRERVPTLVFAGRVGWLVSDLMQQLRNADFLDGKILMIEDPTDDELERLYSGCRFTLFPSLYEGWGLPVTESLSFGKPCIISRATSLPEAGGDLARYFDPENCGEAYEVIRHAIETPQETEAWAEQVRRDFKPVSWDESARSVLQALGALLQHRPTAAGKTLDRDQTAMHRI